MKLTLRAARINAGLTQTDVLNKTGWARSTLTRWERYETLPPAKKRKRLCDLYGVPEGAIQWKKPRH